MPEARDRLSREEDVTDNYINRRRDFFILADEPEVQTPFRWRDTPLVGDIRTPMTIRRQESSFRRTPVGLQNLSPVVRRGQGRGSVQGRGRGLGRGRGHIGSVLPSWYIRKPLHDITYILGVSERRRTRRGETEGLRLESPVRQDPTDRHPSVPAPDAQLEHDSMTTPHPSIRVLRCPPSVPKILLDITKQNDNDSECLTPQRMLLNNIEVVEKVVLEELKKAKRTPSARKAEREKKVRTLMSMR